MVRKGDKMNTRFYKVIITVLSLVSFIMYYLFIIYSDKAHKIFVLMDSTLNSILYHYSYISSVSFSLFIIFIHLIAFALFGMNMKNKVKGLLYLISTALVIFTFCFGLEIVFNYSYFNFNSDFLQFAVIMLSLFLLYSILCSCYLIRKKFKSNQFSSIK